MFNPTLFRLFKNTFHILTVHSNTYIKNIFNYYQVAQNIQLKNIFNSRCKLAL